MNSCVLKQIAARLASLAPVLFGVSVAAFLSLSLFPGDPAQIALTALTDSETPPEEAILELRHEMGLDRPIPEQYLVWLKRTLSGNLGQSIQSGRSVTEELKEAAAPSIFLGLAAIAMTAIIAIPAGTMSAVRAGGKFDKIALAGSLLVVSIPDFFLAVILILIFSLQLRLVPVAGYGHWYNVVLPALSLALINSAISTRLMRTSMLQAMRGSYMLLSRAKGLSETRVMGKHALKNAIVPVIHYMGTQAGHFVGGAVVVESIFLWPGIGKLLVDSVKARDIFVVQGCILAIGAAYVLTILLTDMLGILLDPRFTGENNASA